MDADQTPLYDVGWISDFKNLSDVVMCDQKDCTNSATRFTRTTCCRETLITCLPDLESHLRFLFRMSENHDMVKCRHCGENIEPKEWLEKSANLRLTAPDSM